MSERDTRAGWLISEEELEQRFGKPPEEDMSPLSEQEKEALRAKKTAPGGGRLALPPRELQAWYHMTALRPPEEMAAVVQAIRRARQETDFAPDSLDYFDGILAAITWANGIVRTAPLSGRPCAGPLPIVDEMDDEQQVALERLRTGQYPPGRKQSFVVGVEACLMWLCASCDDPPWDP